MNVFAVSQKKRMVISLGIHSAAIIAFQISLMQLLSVVQWHHFAFMIISIAMLGFGASGTLLSLFRQPLLEGSNWIVPMLMTLCGLCIMLAFPVIRLELFTFDAYLLFVDRSQFFILAANYLIFFIPFFFGALAIGILFIQHSRQIGLYYFSNLMGSGLGGAVALLLLSQMLPQTTPPVMGLMSVFAGIFCMSPKYKKYQLALGLVSLFAASYFIASPGTIPISQYKSLARTLNLPEAQVIYRKPGIPGLIEVVESPSLRYAPAVSLSYTGEMPVKKNIFLNGEFSGVISSHHPVDEPHILEFTTQQLPFVAANRDKVLVLNAGSGVSVAHALKNNASQVEAVIENPGIIALMLSPFYDASHGLLNHSRVRIHSQESRHFLASQGNGPQWDLITMPLMDAFGGTSGLHALRENYALTLEAFSLMWQQLSPQGVIAASSWMDYPSRSTLKILSTLVATAKNHGIHNPKDHLLGVRSWGTITFLLKKTPFTIEESQKVHQWCGQLFFDPVLLPHNEDFEKEQFNLMQDQAFFSYVDRIMNEDQEFYKDYGFSIHPSTDNTPYFSQFFRIKHFNHLASIFGQENVPLLELGYLILIVTLVQSTLFAIILIILPLFGLGGSPRRKTGTLFYFGALGLGYMFAEIIMIQRFVLYFGQPVYAIAAVITTMLIASGAGSLYSGRLPLKPASIFRIALLVSALFLVFVFFLTPLLQNTMGMPLGAKVTFSLFLIGIPAFFMGMLFPLGIRFLSHYDQRQIPWAWGINGCLSVISTSLATLTAVEAGFQMVILIAVISYFLAATTFLLHGFFFKKQQL